MSRLDHTAQLPADGLNRSRHQDPQPNRIDSPQKQISTAEAAKLLGVSMNSIRKYVEDGLIPAVRIGPRLLKFNRTDIEKLRQVIDNRPA